MIFVTVGSRDYQFNRLIKELDELIGSGKIKEKVIMQIGKSTYLPKHTRYVDFMSELEFNKNQEEADIIISHGGSGSIVTSLKKGKKIIVVPRLKRFKEHIDDHQLQICNFLEKEHYIYTVLDIKDLYKAISEIKLSNMRAFTNEGNILNIIKDYIGL